MPIVRRSKGGLGQDSNFAIQQLIASAQQLRALNQRSAIVEAQLQTQRDLALGRNLTATGNQIADRIFRGREAEANRGLQLDLTNIRESGALERTQLTQQGAMDRTVLGELGATERTNLTQAGAIERALLAESGRNDRLDQSQAHAVGMADLLAENRRTRDRLQDDLTRARTAQLVEANVLKAQFANAQQSFNDTFNAVAEMGLTETGLDDNGIDRLMEIQEEVHAGLSDDAADAQDKLGIMQWGAREAGKIRLKNKRRIPEPQELIRKATIHYPHGDYVPTEVNVEAGTVGKYKFIPNEKADTNDADSKEAAKAVSDTIRNFSLMGQPTEGEGALKEIATGAAMQVNATKIATLVAQGVPFEQARQQVLGTPTPQPVAPEVQQAQQAAESATRSGPIPNRPVPGEVQRKGPPGPVPGMRLQVPPPPKLSLEEAKALHAMFRNEQEVEQFMVNASPKEKARLREAFRIVMENDNGG